MPGLDTSLHLDMYRAGKRRRTLVARMKRAWAALSGHGDLYGLEWGDPETSPPLRYVRDHFLLPYLRSGITALEIGPGGGRWTRYMLGVKRLYAVDFHRELLDELAKKFGRPPLVFVKNGGTDFPGVPPRSVDFVFSFGTFVHLDIELISAYLENMKRVLKPDSQVILQYADTSKPLGQSNPGFSANDPDTMRRLVLSHGYVVHEEDVKTLWHSAVIRFGPSSEVVAQADVGVDRGGRAESQAVP